MHLWVWFATLLLLAPLATGTTPYQSFPELRGPWLGQDPPGDTPQVFAEGILKPPSGYHSAVVFNAAGDEAYWTGMSSGETYCSRYVDGVWITPELVPFDPEFGVREPMLAFDDTRLYYLSRRPLPDDPVNRERIWFVERVTSGWSEPRAIDPVVRAHPTHWQFSFNNKGDLYFTSEIDGVRGPSDIYVARWRGNDKYDAPVSVGGGINSDSREFCPFIAPDESYLIFARSMPGCRSDLFISFRGKDGKWKDAVYISEGLRSEHNEVSPVVTADGAYLFFLRVSGDINDVFWLKTENIEGLGGGSPQLK